MEIADLIVINKFDGEYKKVCRGLQRKMQGALSLTMSKHHSSSNSNYKTDVDPAGFWHCPVELVSAEAEYNVTSIWRNASIFKDTMGPEYLENRRQMQTRRSMWNYLSASLMTTLQGKVSTDVHKYS